ncbi:DUF6587 family protein [Cognatilysobacter segetis]|uniref:DUF6587 family protein n=1 Tax=Cognatilysobacter segetis TaxID=2492394 RepID=UPI00105FA770|nr:DUF6587 family protein [Lysobacter segetis]
MDGLALQYVVVGAAVAASALYVFLTRFPATARRLRGWIAIRLVDSGSATLSKFGRRLAPKPRAQDGCGTCGGCDPPG